MKLLIQARILFVILIGCNEADKKMANDSIIQDRPMFHKLDIRFILADFLDEFRTYDDLPPPAKNLFRKKLQQTNYLQNVRSSIILETDEDVHFNGWRLNKKTSRLHASFQDSDCHFQVTLTIKLSRFNLPKIEIENILVDHVYRPGSHK